MSNLNVSNVNAATINDEVPYDPMTDSGRAKIWAKLNGSGSISVLDSYNISSVTDNGTGNYTFNFAITMAANYVITASSKQSGSNNNNNATPLSQSTGSANVVSSGTGSGSMSSSGRVDSNPMNITIHGDMA